MTRPQRLIASLLSSTLLVASAGVSAQTAPPPSAPTQPAPPVQAPPPSAPPPQAPPPAYVTPPPQQGYPQQGYPQQGYPQQGLPPPQAWRPPQRPSKGLMITGISILAGSYLVAMLVGGSLLDEDDEDGDYSDCESCAKVAPYLFIPLAGPFVAMSQTKNDGGLIVLGMVEMVGAALTIGGIVRYQNTKRAASFSEYSLDLRENRSLSFGVGATPRMAGPRMTLRF